MSKLETKSVENSKKFAPIYSFVFSLIFFEIYMTVCKKKLSTSLMLSVLALFPLFLANFMLNECCLEIVETCVGDFVDCKPCIDHLEVYIKSTRENELLRESYY